MKRFLILLSLLLLLAGCQTVTPEGMITSVTDVPQTNDPLEFSLLDHGESTGSTGNLMYIPNSYVESMLIPEMVRYGNDLLLYEVTPTGRLELKLVSLADGSLLAEASYPFSPVALVQTENGIVSICDYGTGKVLILNNSLQTEKSYQVPVEGEYWYLDPETEVLYEFFMDTGLMARDLATGETRWLLENVAFLKSYGLENGYVLFSYTDRANQKTYNSCLDLSGATLETAPAGGFRSGIRWGEQWFLQQDDMSGKYMLLQPDDTGTFVWPEGLCTLLSDKQQLLMSDGDYRELYLYDLEGKFLSHCMLPEIEYGGVGTDLVWNDHWQGYFFQDNYDGIPHLMFWDPNIPQDGENLVWDDDAPAHVMEQEFYDRAAAIFQRFGVEIRIADQCTLRYTAYQSEMLTDPIMVGEALNTIEQALSVYPEGFFEQLLYDNVQTIRIELVDGLKNHDQTNGYSNAANGVAEKKSDHYLIVLDGVDLGMSTVHHEFSHVIDKRLEWDALLRPEALYSEETWLSLQPEGFRYANSYLDMPDEVQEFAFSGYFARSYGMTYPTEDRATLMAMAMASEDALDGNPNLKEKMAYYAACIRDCFDTTTWPEKTAWE